VRVLPGIQVTIFGSWGRRRKERECSLARDPVYNLAQGLVGYAGELAGYLSDGFAPLTDGDRADLLRVLAQATEKISRCAAEICPAPAGGREYARCLVEEAADAIEVAGWHLEEAGLQIVAGPVTETAWTAGAEHAKAGRPPAVTDSEGDLAWDSEAARELAASLPFPPSEGTSGEVAHWAAVAYREAYADAAGQHGPVAEAGKYLAGQQVATALGRQGTLTGEAGTKGHPRVRFIDGQESTVPRGAIEGPLVHVVGTREELADATHPDPARASRQTVPGDVLLVQSDNSTWLFSRGEAMPPTDAALPARYCGREEAGLRMSEKLASPKGATAGLARMGFPASPSAMPPTAAAARKSTAPSSSGPARFASP
jgi:hypothetical protein